MGLAFEEAHHEDDIVSPKTHTVANISEKLVDLRLEFGLYLKEFMMAKLRNLRVCGEELDKLLYFTLGTPTR